MASQVFVGRQRELAVLAELTARARADQPQAVLVEGEAGMGKSSLITRFVPAVSGAAVLRASGEEGESSLSYGVISQVAAAAGSLGVAAPALLSGELAESLDPLAVGAELLSVFDTLGRSGQLTLLLVDDLHWSDPLSARALLFCLRRLLADRILVVVTARPGQLACLGEGWYRFFAGDERATRLRLDPLGTAEVVELSRELGTGRLSQPAAALLLEHTAGNPLYCVALLQELGAGQLDRAQGPPRVPRDLASLLLARVSRLQPAAQDLVMAAAVLGQRSPLRLAGELAGIEDPQAAVEQAAGASVLAEVPGELGEDISFVHPLVRSAVYYDLGAARRMALHRRAAGLLGGERSLAHRVAAAAGPDEALAADLEEAARAAQRSGRRMLAASLFAQAATASAEAAPRERRLLDAFEAHLAGGDVAGAEALAPLVEQASPGVRRSALLGTLDLFAGRLVSAEQRLNEAWQAGDRSQPSLAGALCEQVTVCLMQARGDEAVLWGRRAVEAAESSPLAHHRARCLLSQALVWTYRVAEALALLEQLPGPLASVNTARLRALLSMESGDRAAASRAFAAAWQHASGLRVPLVLARLEMDEARFLRHGGQRKRALARLRSASARLAALGAGPCAQLCDQELARCQAQPRPGETRRELGLSTAEFAVARAVAKGLTNKEAADQLYLSVKTIEFHLSHIYMKLGIHSRRELARLLEEPEQGSLSAGDEGAPHRHGA